MNDRFYITGGTLPLDADSYVTRRADMELFECLQRGEFCYVLNTRQVGKSSLMVRVAQSLRAEGVRVVLLDPTAIGVNVTVEEWYDGLLTIIAEQLSLRRELENFWLENPRLGPMQRWMQALEHVALAGSPEPLCIFVDEIDSVQSLPFSADEFFGGIRECYNRRAYNPAFGRLTFCLLGVAAPVDLIADARITPFNIGRRIELTDFTPEEAAPLENGLNYQCRKGEKEKRRKGEGERKETRNIRGTQRQEDALPLSSGSFSPFLLFSFSSPLNRVLYWTGGHPYLTQKLCSALAQSKGVPTNADVDAVCNELFLSRRGQKTDDNLAFARSRLLYEETYRAALLDIYQRILDGRKIRDDATNPLHSILRLSGIAQADDGFLTVRNRIYAHVFNKRWARENMPGEELRRQKAAYRRGLWRAVGLSSGVVAALAALTLVALQQARIARQQTDIARQKTDLANHNSEEANRNAKKAQINLDLANRRKRDLDAALTNAKNIAATNARLAESRAQVIQDLEQEKQNAHASARRANKSAHNARVAENHAKRMAAKNLKLVTLRESDLKAVKKANAKADLHLYNADINLIQRDLESGNVLQAAQLLQDTVHSDYRHFEWYFLDQERHLERKTFQDKQATKALSVAWLPNENYAVVGGEDGKVRIRDADTGKLIRVLQCDKYAATAVACSPDGKTIATGGREGMARLWDAHTGQLARELRHQDSGRSHTAVICSLAFSPDGNRLVSASEDYAIRVWDLKTGALDREWTRIPFLVRSVVFSPDGKSVLAGTADALALVLNVASGKQEAALKGHTRDVMAVAFAPNGDFFVTGSSDHTACIWNAATKTLRVPLKGHLSNIACVAISPDSKWIATGSEDNTCRIWDASTGMETMRLVGHSRVITSVAFSPDGALLLTGSEDGTAKIWDAHDDHKALALKETGTSLTSIAYSPDGRRLITGLGKCLARVWDTRTGKVAFTLPNKGAFSKYIQSVVFSKDGRYIATGGRDGTARVWDAQTGRELQNLSCNTVVVNSVAFSPDGKHLATVFGEGKATLWEWETGRPLHELKGHQQAIFTVAFAPGGKTLVTGSADTKAILWDAQTGKSLRVFNGNESHVFGVAFAPDGKRIVTAGADHTVRVWEVATGREIHRLLGHRDWVWCVAYSRDGRRILTGSYDKTARLWDAETGQEMLTISDTNFVNAVAFAPDGKHIATANQDGIAKIWPAAPSNALSRDLEVVDLCRSWRSERLRHRRAR